jgi:Protein of unknown function (DUF3106)
MKPLVTMIVLVSALVMGAGAQDRPGGNEGKDKGKHAQRWQKGKAAGEHQPGQWLRKYNNLPPEQQEQMLKQDPEFQKLSAEKQQQLLDRLRRFNQKTPEERDKMISRMERFEQLTPDQRQRLMQFQQRLKELPEDRRDQVRKAFRHLHNMTPEQRQEVFNSPRFKQMFNEKEQELVKSMVEADIDE